MTAVADAPALSELSEDQLARLYDQVSWDAEARRLLEDEISRRERNERARASALHQRRTDPVVADWSDSAVAQFQAAERACQGNLVRRGIEITDPFTLWSGPEWLARKRATEELNNFWDSHPRIPTVSEWREHERGDVPPDEGEPMTETYDAPTVVQPVTRADRIAELRAEGRKRAEAMRQNAGAGTVAVRDGSSVASQRQAVNGAETLEYARRFLAHMCLFPTPEALITTALWVGHSHARDADGRLVWLASPRLLFTSNEPGSGKSHAMELAAQLCPSPAVMIEPTMPALVHSVGTAHDTVALDEVDVYFGGGQGSRKQAARAIINAGYSGTGAYRRMYKGEAQKVPCFGAMMMAGLGKITFNTELEATLSRCHKIVMKRAPENYRAPRMDKQAQFAAKLISERLAAFTAQNLDALASHVPDVPEGLKPREAELWEPLLSIADLAGGDWPELARAACVEMVASGGQPPADEDKLRELDEIMTAWGTETVVFTEED